MAHLTDNFTSESKPSSAVTGAVLAALNEGWADPKKIGQASGRAAALRQSALEEIAGHWHLPTENLEVVGEPDLLPYLALAGFLSTSTPLVTSSIDIGKVRAVARAFPENSQVMQVNSNGEILAGQIPDGAVISLQLTNGETGIVQDLHLWERYADQIILDATHALPESQIYGNFLALSLSASSWNGPNGIGFLAINRAEKYRYPLPHIAPIRVPGSYSLPLLIGSAIALQEMIAEKSHCYDLRNQLHSHLAAIDGVTVLGGNNDSRYISALISGASGEELLRALAQRDCLIDVGSACSPQDLAPSHVIAEMGFPTEGHIRFTIHPHHNSRDIEKLLHILKEEFELLNR